jgi:class 3 adenylate cyclase
MWYQTDVRDILSSVRVPALVLYKTGATNWGTEAHARYLAGLIPAAQLTGVSGSAPVLWIEEPEPLVRAIEAFLLSVHDQEEDLGRVLATVLFTDIVGSTETAYQLGDRAWKDVVERHHTTTRALLTRYRGQEVDTAGDGFFASFDGPARAIRCAQAITAAVGSLGLAVRAGLHTGEVETVDGKLGGIAVSIGARVGALAQPSEVLVSETVKDLVAGSGLEFHDRGTYQLKGVPGDWHLYAAS